MAAERQYRSDDRELKRLLDDLERQEPDVETPGKGTLAEQIDQLAMIRRHRSAKAGTKGHVGVGPSRPGQRALVGEMLMAVPKLEFADCRALALRDVLSRLRNRHRLQEETLAAADPDVARRVARREPSAPVTPDGRAMWGAANQRAVTLYRRATATGMGAPETQPVADAIGAIGCGIPLAADVRRRLEAVLHVSLEGVRLHIGPVARAAAAAVCAEAFTVGEDIFFPGYDPASSRCQETLAHEVVHCIQWRQGRIQAIGVTAVSRPDDPLEREAEHQAKSIVARAFRGPEEFEPAATRRSAAERQPAPVPMEMPLGPTLPSADGRTGVPALVMRLATRASENEPLNVSAWSIPQRIDDVILSVTQAHSHVPEVGGQYVELLQENWAWIGGTIAASVAAYKLVDVGSKKMMTSLDPRAAISGAVIQLLLQAARVAAILSPIAKSVTAFNSHVEKWVETAWNAEGNPEEIAIASREIVRAVASLVALACSLFGALAAHVFKWMRASPAAAPKSAGSRDLPMTKTSKGHVHDPGASAQNSHPPATRSPKISARPEPLAGSFPIMVGGVEGPSGNEPPATFGQSGMATELRAVDRQAKEIDWGNTYSSERLRKSKAIIDKAAEVMRAHGYGVEKIVSNNTYALKIIKLKGRAQTFYRRLVRQYPGSLPELHYNPVRTAENKFGGTEYRPELHAVELDIETITLTDAGFLQPLKHEFRHARQGNLLKKGDINSSHGFLLFSRSAPRNNLLIYKTGFSLEEILAYSEELQDAINELRVIEGLTKDPQFFKREENRLLTLRLMTHLRRSIEFVAEMIKTLEHSLGVLRTTKGSIIYSRHQRESNTNKVTFSDKKQNKLLSVDSFEHRSFGPEGVILVEIPAFRGKRRIEGEWDFIRIPMNKQTNSDLANDPIKMLDHVEIHLTNSLKQAKQWEEKVAKRTRKVAKPLYDRVLRTYETAQAKAVRDVGGHRQKQDSASTYAGLTQQLLAKSEPFVGNPGDLLGVGVIRAGLVEQESGNVVSSKINYIRTSTLREDDLGYPGGPRERKDVDLRDIRQAPVKAILNVTPVSEQHNGSAGLVRIGELDNGRPVALKTYYGVDGESDADWIAEEARSAKLDSDLGIGPTFHGTFVDEAGKLNIVFDIVRGDFYTAVPHRINRKTFEDLETILARRAGAQVTDTSGGFDPMIDDNGRLLLIDSSGAARKIGKKMLGSPNDESGYFTRERYRLAVVAHPEVTAQYVADLERSDPEAYRGLKEYYAIRGTPFPGR